MYFCQEYHRTHVPSLYVRMCNVNKSSYCGVNFDIWLIKVVPGRFLDCAVTAFPLPLINILEENFEKYATHKF